MIHQNIWPVLLVFLIGVPALIAGLYLIGLVPVARRKFRPHKLERSRKPWVPD